MKFQLFGRLRDDDSGEESNTRSRKPSGPGGLGGGDNEMNFGSELDSTVENMFSQGYSEDEIKQELQGQYPENEIERSINNAVASSATGNNNSDAPEPMSPYQGEQEAVSPVDEGFSDNQAEGNDNMTQPENNPQDIQTNSNLQQQEPQQTGNAPQQQSRGRTADPQVEELVETIVAENFDIVKKEFENVYSEIDEIKEGLEDMEQRVHDLEVRDDEDQQEFIQKVDEMEEHIDSYQSRMGGLEKAFQQVLPSLVDNVRNLTDLVQEIKQERGIETETDVNKKDIEDLDTDEWD